AQIEAYNAHDVDRFVECYAEGVIVEDAGGNVLMEGRDDMRAQYAPFFAAYPELRGQVLQRIVAAEHVIDEERIDGWQDQPVRAVIIYHLQDGLIDHVRFLEG